MYFLSVHATRKSGFRGGSRASCSAGVGERWATARGATRGSRYASVSGGCAVNWLARRGSMSRSADHEYRRSGSGSEDIERQTSVSNNIC